MITWRSERLAPYVEKLVWIESGSTEPFTVYPDMYRVMGFQNIGQAALVNGDQTQPLKLTAAQYTPLLSGQSRA